MPLSGHISGGRAKGAKAHMSMQTVIFNKAALRGERKKKTWLGMPTSLTVGMFVWGNNSMKIVRLDS